MAKKVCTPFAVFLQEISQELEPISQRDLEDFRNTLDVFVPPELTATREWHARLRNNIGTRLDVGVPIEPGSLTARISKGCVLVINDETEVEGE